jgi:hypothetical protein
MGMYTDKSNLNAHRQVQLQDIPYLSKGLNGDQHVFIWCSHMNLSCINSGRYNFWKESCILWMYVIWIPVRSFSKLSKSRLQKVFRSSWAHFIITLHNTATIFAFCAKVSISDLYCLFHTPLFVVVYSESYCSAGFNAPTFRFHAWNYHLSGWLYCTSSNKHTYTHTHTHK